MYNFKAKIYLRHVWAEEQMTYVGFVLFAVWLSLEATVLFLFV